MLFKAFFGGVITLAIVAMATQITFPPRPVLLYNPSASAPIGWYKVQRKSSFNVGEKVAVFAPPWARKLADERGYLPREYPLIKTIIAGPHQEICFKNGAVSVPDYPDIPVLAQDSLGREMPRLSGCQTLKEGEYFIASPDVQAGFDSRYFGPVGLKISLER